MKKEIIYRLIRILIISFILVTFTLMRETTKESYEKLENSNLLNNLQITNITNVINKKENKNQDGNNNSYTFEIKNMENKPRKITFKIENNSNNQIDNKYVKYQILKDNKEVITNNIKNDQILYEENLEKFSKHEYKIKFWIDTPLNSDIEGESFDAKLKII